jgi:cytochrome c oxidase subunit 2
MSPTTIFAPVSAPADAIFGLSLFVLAITGTILVIVSCLLTYAIIRFRKRTDDDGDEPPQVYGSQQIELAWTIVPMLIVVVLFLSTARVIVRVQQAEPSSSTIEVVATGHQFWWEFRYPGLGVVTANELHVPVSDSANPTPTFLTLLSADTDHSFWVPRLAGKTDLIPNQINRMWIAPREPGLYVGQCAQYCGTQHAKMLLRVYVDTRTDFDRWVEAQRQPAPTGAADSEGARVFQRTACVNCHTVSTARERRAAGAGAAIPAAGQFGPDLTHLMSRETIAAGAAPNTPERLRLWIQRPDAIKPGALMPSMRLSDHDLDALTTYLTTLR